MTGNTANATGLRGFFGDFRARGRLMALLAAVFLLAAAAPADAAKHASLVLDAKTGRVLHSVNADDHVYPASLTKMMTLYKVFEAIESGRWSMNTKLRMSQRAALQPASKMGLPAGDTISVRDAILALVIKSANDIATAVAENHSGRERDFALKMTETARRLGMSNTTFRNASGLPHSSQMTTARDMAKLAKALLRDFPQHYHFFAQTRFEFRGAVHKTHNELLLSYDGADGFKTGYIRASGFNLVTSAERNGRRLIAVVIGGNTARARNNQMAGILDDAFGMPAKGVAIAKADVPTESEARETAESQQEAATAASARRVADAGPAKVMVFDKHSRWGIQVGAFARSNQAHEVAVKAQHTLPNLLEDGIVSVVPLTKKNGTVLHRARLYGLSKQDAFKACKLLERKRIPCMELRAPESVEVAALENNL